MKKLAILAALGIMAVSASCWAAALATVSANNYDADKAIFYLTQGTATPITQNVMVQILGGPAGTPATGQQLATVAGTQQTDFPINQVAGYFDAGTVTIPGVTAGSPADITLRAFAGTSWDAATARGSVSWTGQATGSWDPAAQPPAAPTGPALAIPSSILITPTAAIPEPSTIALGLLGAAALLIRRRK